MDNNPGNTKIDQATNGLPLPSHARQETGPAANSSKGTDDSADRSDEGLKTNVTTSPQPADPEPSFRRLGRAPVRSDEQARLTGATRLARSWQGSNWGGYGPDREHGHDGHERDDRPALRGLVRADRPLGAGTHDQTVELDRSRDRQLEDQAVARMEDEGGAVGRRRATVDDDSRARAITGAFARAAGRPGGSANR